MKALNEIMNLLVQYIFGFWTLAVVSFFAKANTKETPKIKEPGFQQMSTERKQTMQNTQHNMSSISEEIEDEV